MAAFGAPDDAGNHAAWRHGSKRVCTLENRPENSGTYPGAPPPLTPPQRRVLIVDDDVDFSESVRQVLEIQDCTARIANSSAEAVDVASHYVVDIALVDIRLGHDSGLELFEHLKPHLPDTLFILMTGYAETKTAIAALQKGAYDYLLKPMDPASFLSTLERGFKTLMLDYERRMAEKALRESEARYRHVVEDQTDFIVRWRPDGTRTFVNDSYCRFFGIAKDDVIGSSFFPLISDEDRAGVARRIAALSAENPVSVGEHRVNLPGNKTAWNEWSDRAIFSADGSVHEYQSVGRDITVRKRDEETMRAIIKGTVAATGNDFFQCLVQHMAAALDVAYIFVTEWTGSGDGRVRTLAFWDRDKPGANFAYDPAGSPCQDVLTGEIRYVENHTEIASQLAQNLPFDTRDVTSYVGVPLFDSASGVLGHMVILDSAPIPRDEHNASVTDIFAVRAGTELERIRAENEIKRLNSELEDRVEQRTTALRQSENRLRALFEGTSLAVLLQRDIDGRIISCNDAASQLFGCAERSQLIGRYIHEFTPLRNRRRKNVAAFVQQEFSTALQFGKHRFEWKIQRVNGDEIPVELFLTAIPVGGDRQLQVIMTDISERKRVENELCYAKVAAEAANRAKSEFLASMSHELRTPLNGILGYAQILAGSKNLLESEKAGVHVIRQSGDHLLTLINDILDLAKIEAGKTDVKYSDFNLQGLLTTIVDMTMVRIGQKAITFQFEMAPDIPVAVRGDEQKLRQILLNLLGNAIKFTEKGHITLCVTRAPASAESAAHHAEETDHNAEETDSDGAVSMPVADGSDSATLSFAVKDTGIGIDPARLDEIFQPFQQISDVARHIEGTGLGLAISRRLARVLGTHLAVESRQGEGSCFSFDLTLPVVPDTNAGNAGRSRRIVGYEGPRQTVLVVDDEPVNRMVLRDLLQPLGFDIIEARNGCECVDIAQDCKPSLILMDLIMPKVDGYQAAQRLREIRDSQDIVIIALSASVFAHDRQHSLESGCDEFLPKPIDADSLLEHIQRLLGLTWIYAPATQGAATRTDGQGDTMIAPPAASLYKLCDMALIGDIQGIRGELDAIRNLDDRYAGFLSVIGRHADSYDMQKIRDVLKPYHS